MILSIVNILEVEEIVNKLKNLKLNSIEDKVEVLTIAETKKLYMKPIITTLTYNNYSYFYSFYPYFIIKSILKQFLSCH